MVIDVTMTAVLRPKIVERTCASFQRHLFRHAPTRLIANIDGVGENVHPMDQAKLMKSYFSDIKYRFARECSFPKAFCWTWRRTESEFFFNLEDDWELLKSISLSAMVATMDRIPDLAILRLSMFNAGTDSMKTWNKFIPYNAKDGFFECPEEIRHRVGFCGHPSLIRKEWADQMMVYLDDKRNPEKQMQLCHPESPIGLQLRKWRYGIWAVPNEPASIRDIGRNWIKDAGLQKAGTSAWFTNYEVVEGANNGTGA